jgi:Ser/Thr protein kinase RdoA (MazF antagonist)
MTHLATAGLDTVPRLRPHRAFVAPVGNVGSETLVGDHSGRLWELVAFLSGRPRPAPSHGEAAAALDALARLHVAAATLPGSAPAVEPSPGIRARLTQAARMRAAPWRRLAPETRLVAPPAVAGRLLEAIEVFESSGGPGAIQRIAAVEQAAVAAQPVLRDVWSDHVLFTEDGRLAGFIDLHAAGRDTPATDLARLLGSWEAPSATNAAAWLRTWRHALDAYEAVRPLVPGERRLIPWLHAAGVICGLDNWFRWLIAERREFADISGVQARIARLVAALPEAVSIAADIAPGRD